ncbi:MAG: hypothetical protein AB3N11_01915 [Arenibacterium sp.]
MNLKTIALVLVVGFFTAAALYWAAIRAPVENKTHLFFGLSSVVVFSITFLFVFFSFLHYGRSNSTKLAGGHRLVRMKLGSRIMSGGFGAALSSYSAYVIVRHVFVTPMSQLLEANSLVLIGFFACLLLIGLYEIAGCFPQIVWNDEWIASRDVLFRWHWYFWSNLESIDTRNHDLRSSVLYFSNKQELEISEVMDGHDEMIAYAKTHLR